MTAPLRPPLVITRGRRRTLEFLPGNVQSEMDLRRPDRLVLAYTRAMMLFALFVPRPRHIVMVGLGGGSLAKFCYRAFPAARITVLELRADVIALRDQFRIPPDDARLRVLHADAAAWLETSGARCDVLLVDGFDAMGLNPVLAEARFLGACRRVLEDGGVMAMNLFSYDPALPGILARLGLMFGERICWFDGVSGNNRIVFSVRAPLDGSPAAAPRAVRVQQRTSVRQGKFYSSIINRLRLRLLLWRLGRSAAATS
jgi:spermidine synthase